MHRGHDHDHESGGSLGQLAIPGVGHNHVNSGGGRHNGKCCMTIPNPAATHAAR
jgi:hypothetical protein